MPKNMDHDQEIPGLRVLGCGYDVISGKYASTGSIKCQIVAFGRMESTNTQGNDYMKPREVIIREVDSEVWAKSGGKYSLRRTIEARYILELPGLEELELVEDFAQDIDDADVAPRELFKTWGTHLLLNIVVGIDKNRDNGGEEYLEFADFTTTSLKPVWEFAHDEARREELKNYYEKVTATQTHQVKEVA